MCRIHLIRTVKSQSAETNGSKWDEGRLNRPLQKRNFGSLTYRIIYWWDLLIRCNQMRNTYIHGLIEACLLVGGWLGSVEQVACNKTLQMACGASQLHT